MNAKLFLAQGSARRTCAGILWGAAFLGMAHCAQAIFDGVKGDQIAEVGRQVPARYFDPQRPVDRGNIHGGHTLLEAVAMAESGGGKAISARIEACAGLRIFHVEIASAVEKGFGWSFSVLNADGSAAGWRPVMNPCAGAELEARRWAEEHSKLCLAEAIVLAECLTTASCNGSRQSSADGKSCFGRKCCCPMDGW